jgi:hypothetical protein
VTNRELLKRSANGASRPLRRIPAIVSFLNPQPALSPVGGNGSSCPEADLGNASGLIGVGLRVAVTATFLTLTARLAFK